jgi:putative FmdB family regulatory protein
MPTYEYECQACRRQFEVFQSIRARPLRQCPHCKGRVRRLIGKGAGIIFKGSGFYQTDYRSSQYKKRAQEEKKSAEPAASGKKDGSASPVSKETKPAAAKE